MLGKKDGNNIVTRYLIGQNFVGQKFRRTKFFVGQNFRHLAKISSLLSDEIASEAFSSDKIFVTSQKNCSRPFNFRAPFLREFDPSNFRAPKMRENKRGAKIKGSKVLFFFQFIDCTYLYPPCIVHHVVLVLLSLTLCMVAHTSSILFCFVKSP